MYDELVKRLWECASGECFNCSQYTPTTNASVCQKELMKQAADAIEELSKKRVGTWHRIKGTKKSYLFICNSCGEMYPYLTACCPFCGVKYKGERAPKEEAT